MAYTASKLLEIARAELGYKEKASNSQLDDKEANAGKNNWTKYARDLHTAGYYSAPKNGYAWCDMFVDWCFWQLAGQDKTKGEWLECQTGVYGAGCKWSSSCYRWANRCGTTPKIGAQIFFAKNGEGSEEHTGIVENFDDTYVYTIEGNEDNQVKRRTYKRTSSYVLCYGYPRFDEEESTTESVSEIAADHFKEGDVVSIVGGANWLTGSGVPSWVLKKNWIVKKVSTTNGQVIIDKSEDGVSSVNSPIHFTSLKLVKAAAGSGTVKEDSAIDGIYVKGTALKLTKNFKSTEFDCPGTGCCAATLADQTLVEYLQNIRAHFAKSTKVRTGYVCPQHAKNIADIDPLHQEGKAADIYIEGIDPIEIARYAESIGVPGVGVYKDVVHLDLRADKKFWYGDCDHEDTVVSNAKDATCTESGYTGDTVCTRCNEVVAAGQVIPETGHDYVLTGKVDPTATTEGYSGDKVCSVCGHKVEGKTLDKLITVDPKEEDVVITVKKSWLERLINWLLSLLK